MEYRHQKRKIKTEILRLKILTVVVIFQAILSMTATTDATTTSTEATTTSTEATTTSTEATTTSTEATTTSTDATATPTDDATTSTDDTATSTDEATTSTDATTTSTDATTTSTEDTATSTDATTTSTDVTTTSTDDTATSTDDATTSTDDTATSTDEATTSTDATTTSTDDTATSTDEATTSTDATTTSTDDTATSTDDATTSTDATTTSTDDTATSTDDATTSTDATTTSTDDTATSTDDTATSTDDATTSTDATTTSTDDTATSTDDATTSTDATTTSTDDTATSTDDGTTSTDATTTSTDDTATSTDDATTSTDATTTSTDDKATSTDDGTTSTDATTTSTDATTTSTNDTATSTDATTTSTDATTTSTDDTATSTDDTTTSTDATTTSTDDTATSTDDATTSTDATTTSTDDTATSTDDATTSTDDATTSTDATTTSTDDTATSTDDATTSTDATTTSTDATTTSTDDTATSTDATTTSTDATTTSTDDTATSTDDATTSTDATTTSTDATTTSTDATTTSTDATTTSADDTATSTDDATTSTEAITTSTDATTISPDATTTSTDATSTSTDATTTSTDATTTSTDATTAPTDDIDTSTDDATTSTDATTTSTDAETTSTDATTTSTDATTTSTDATTASTDDTATSTDDATTSTDATTTSTDATTASTDAATTSTDAATTSTDATTTSTDAPTTSTDASTTSTDATTASTDDTATSTDDATTSTDATTTTIDATTASTDAATTLTDAAATSTDATTTSTDAPTTSTDASTTSTDATTASTDDTATSTDDATTSTDATTTTTDATTASTDAAATSTDAATTSTDATTTSTDATTTSTDATTASTDYTATSTDDATTSTDATTTTTDATTASTDAATTSTDAATTSTDATTTSTDATTTSTDATTASTDDTATSTDDATKSTDATTTTTDAATTSTDATTTSTDATTTSTDAITASTDDTATSTDDATTSTDATTTSTDATTTSTDATTTSTDATTTSTDATTTSTIMTTVTSDETTTPVYVAQTTQLSMEVPVNMSSVNLTDSAVKEGIISNARTMVNNALSGVVNTIQIMDVSEVNGQLLVEFNVTRSVTVTGAEKSALDFSQRLQDLAAGTRPLRYNEIQMVPTKLTVVRVDNTKVLVSATNKTCEVFEIVGGVCIETGYVCDDNTSTCILKVETTTTSTEATTSSEATTTSTDATTSSEATTTSTEATTSSEATTTSTDATTSSEATTTSTDATTSSEATTTSTDATTSSEATTTSTDATTSSEATTTSTEATTSFEATTTSTDATTSSEATTTSTEATTSSEATTTSTDATTSSEATTTSTDATTSSEATTTSTEATTSSEATTTSTDATTSSEATTTSTDATTSSEATTTSTEATTSSEATTTSTDATTSSEATTTAPTTTTTMPTSTTTTPTTTTTTPTTTTTTPTTTTTTPTTTTTTPTTTTTTPTTTTTTPTTTTTTPRTTTTTPTTTTTTPTTTTTTPTTTTAQPLNTVDSFGLQADDEISVQSFGSTGPFICRHNFLQWSSFDERFYVSQYGYISYNRLYAQRDFSIIPNDVFMISGFNWQLGSDSKMFARELDLGKANEFNVNDIKSQLSKVGAQIQLVSSSFQPIWALIVTWENMVEEDGSDKKTTFQAILATDGCKSYVTFNFLSSTFEDNSPIRPLCGIKTTVKNVVNRYSSTAKLVKANTLLGNINKAGFFIYPIRTRTCYLRTQLAPGNCVNWFADELPSRQAYISAESQRLCPCDPFRAVGLRRHWFVTIFGWWSVRCYSQRNSFFSSWGRECCYKYNRWFIGYDEGEGGGFTTALPSFGFSQWYFTDFTRKLQCCLWSNNCNLYRTVRPLSPVCNRFPLRRFSWFWGDPHISTLDGFGYTFNGYGEYVLISGKNENNATIQIQARTSLAVSSRTNATVNATVFSAYAGDSSIPGAANASRFQIEMNEAQTKLVIYGNGIDITSDFQSKGDYNRTIGDLQFTRENNSQIVTVDLTSLETQLKFTLKGKLLDMSINLPGSFENQGLKGLLGNFNNNTLDEFTLPNGTVMSTENRNYTEREIYFQFGTLWEISKAADKSLFTYPDGKSAKDFRHDDFVPIFADEATPEARKKAEDICGGATKLACIYDYLATGDEKLALDTAGTSDDVDETEKLINNRPPTIEGPLTATFEVNKTGTIVYQFLDDGTPTGSYEGSLTSGDGFNASSVGTTLTINWTPKNTDKENIVINVIDDLKVEGSSIDLNILLCSGCSGNGNCSANTTRTEGISKFKLLTCECNTGYTGDDCEKDEDACELTPCLHGQNCTNLTPAEHVIFGRGYNCSACPSGYKGGEEKCTDINECSNSTLNNCDQVCSNTIGSYSCSCKEGYRLQDNKCTDINECTEATSGCEQKCDNTEGNFTCSCVVGYELLLDGKKCNLTTDICTINNKSCQYACANNSGTFECICKSGYELEANGENCTDVNECNSNICSQQCENSIGSYKCKCLDGFSLQNDQTSCKACEELKWGPSCANECTCDDEGTDKCDPVKGCECKSGYRGTQCEIDINECTETPDICGTTKVCENTGGGYDCNCLTGFEKDDNDNCVDIDECAPNGDSNCTADIAKCENVAGSFRCKCNTGYSQIDDFSCQDVNECTTGSHKCEHLCTNTEGSYTCFCRLGFALNDDRKTCFQVSNPCEQFGSLNCSYACLLENNAVSCYCKQGYLLATDKQTCLDVNECDSPDINGCSKKESCKNIDGGYTCSCDSGQKLDNDERTCKNCDQYHWGDNCVNECGCGQGFSECNNIRGCVCKAGWTGDKCDQDVNECLQSPCTGANERCVNGLGDYTCKCKDGFKNESNSCVNIDECKDGTDACSQTCTDNQGSYTCDCNDGFQLSGKTECVDINECTTGKSKCEQNCHNIVGSYRCSCKTGFLLGNDLQSCKAKTECTGGKCQQKCAVVDGNDVCSCESGYDLVNGTNCTNIDECSNTPKPCQQLCNDTTPGFACYCMDGYQLDADQISCKVCSGEKYGYNCEKNCSCVAENTESCNNVNGTCTCKDGWMGDNCETNVNECQTQNITCHMNSACKDTNGSYVCECDDGYVAASTTQCIKCANTKYGKNCGSSCTCNLVNTKECNHINGSCACKLGWEGTQCTDDVNECNTAGICGNNSKCENNNGSYTCGCKDGYAKEANGECKDVNECLRNANACGANTDCTNTEGNFTCTCKPGFSGDANVKCEACSGFKYGVACAQDCTCNNTNAHDCDNVLGTCNCTSYWTGANCTEDVNECTSKTHDCPNETAECVNKDNGFDCVCKSGYTGTGRDCKECTGFKYGDACAQDCTCNTTNAHDCDNVLGTCNCTSYWTGANCTEDVNECTSKTHDCPNETAECVNKENGFDCVCKSGYTGTGRDCKECTDFKYGVACVQDCTCNTTNAHDCDNVLGTCNCTSYWTGANCTEDVNECTSKTHDCPNETTECVNKDNGFDCVCKSGYTGTGRDCKECTGFKYGVACAQDCTCNTTNAHDCDNVLGTCNCTSYWTGANCTEDVNECTSKTHDCPNETAECVNKENGFDCVCKSGYTGTGRDCKACAEGKYGVNCAETCNCTYEFNNTMACDKTNGQCTCKTGWEGVNCQTDVNECTVNSSICTNIQECQNTNGSYSCKCLHGTEDSGECLPKPTDYPVANNETITEVILKIIVNVSDEDLKNPGSNKYKEIYNLTLAMLEETFGNVDGFLKIIILTLSKGSLDVKFQVVTTKSNAASASLTNTLLNIANNKVTLVYNNESVAVEALQITDSNNNVITISPSSDPCDILQKLQPCSTDYVCRVRNNEAICLYDETDTEFALILGLGVGIPLFLLAVLVIIVLCVYLRKYKKSDDSLDFNRTREEAGFFRSPITPKFNSWSRPAYYSPGGWDGDREPSDSTSTDEDHRPKRKSHRSQYYDNLDTGGYYMYDNGATSNFSWDFMYQYFSPREEYKIKRPSTKPKPDPVYSVKK